MRHITHSLRRLDLRRPRSLVALTLSLFAAITLYFYSQESYEYTSQSLQSLTESIGYMNAKIESWKKVAAWEEANHVQSVALMAPTSTVVAEVSSTPTTEAEALVEAPKVYEKEKGVLVMFARSMDLYKVLPTMRSVEDRMNKRYKYDWLFISDTSHSQSFQRMVNSLTSGEVHFQTVPRRTYLKFPANIDKTRLRDARKMLRQKNVSTVKSQRIKHLQRFWVKDVFKIEALQNYDYFMRIEPDSFFHCDIGFDPFKYMKEEDKTYMFAFATRAEVKGYPTLWSTTLKYIQENPDDIHPKHLLEFVSDDQGETFNGCQFRSKYEIGDLNFFRSELYQKFADYYDQTNGLYYEAWEDSTIRTMAVLLLQDRSKLQFLNNLGYDDNAQSYPHPSLKQCPYDRNVRLKGQCTCDPLKDITWKEESCIAKFFGANGLDIPAEVGPRLKAAELAEIERKKEEEERKYEEEQLRLEREKEKEEKAKLMEMNKAEEAPELEQQEGEAIPPEGDEEDDDKK